MPLTLLNPALLALTVLVAVPLLAHLFAKARPKEMLFPSLRWLKQVERKTTNLRKPKDWLLLLLRTLAVAALILAFLQPLWFGGAKLSAMNARKTVVIVFDQTASMSYVEQGQSRLARATAMANDILKGSGSQALANIVWLGSIPHTAFPEPGVNTEALRDQVRRVNATYEDGDVNAALRLAIEQLGKGEGAKELYLISDFQTAAWKSATLSVPPTVKTYKLTTAESLAANTCLAGIVVQPERPVAGTDARVVCRVRNFAPTETKTTVQLAFGEVRQSRPVALPAWGEGVAEFRVPCGAAGLQPLTASLPEDAFPADDKCFAVVEVRDNWRGALVGAEGDASLALWKRTLGAMGWIDAKGSLSNADVIVSVRDNPSTAADLHAAAERGAVVICQPGADWSGTPWMALWGGDAKSAALSEERRDAKRDKPWTMQTSQDQQSLWQLFASGEYGDPASGNAWRRLQFRTEPETMLLHFTDGVPAVAVQRVGKGWIVAWNIELDEAVSDWVQQPAFLVFVGELLMQHGEGAGKAGARQFGPAQFVTWQPQQPMNPDQVHLLNEAGADVPFEQDFTRTPPALHSRTHLPPGLYRWQVDGQSTEVAAVNFPSDAESDLRCMNPDQIGAGESLSLSATASLIAQRDGLPLWPWCVGIGAALLLIEGLAARTKRREVTA